MKIENVKRGMDDKKILVTANITLTQKKFIEQHNLSISKILRYAIDELMQEVQP